MEQIEQWAANRSFAELNAGEQEMVLAYMSQAAYENLHLVLVAAKTMEQHLHPPASLRTAVLQQFENRNVSKPFPLRWGGLAASFLLGAALMFFLTGRRSNLDSVAGNRPLILHDTLLQHDTIWQSKTVLRYIVRYKTIQVADTIDTTIPVAYHIQRDTSTVGQASRFNLSETGTGLPISDNPELWQFFTAGK